MKQVHEKEKSFWCDETEDCWEIFLRKDQLEKHKILEHNFPKFKCEVCGDKEFLSSAMLSKHRLYDHTSRKLKCQVCEKMFSCAGALNRHERQHGPKSLICDQCGFTAATHHSLNAHKVIHNSIPRHPCPHCPKRFNYLRALNGT